MTPTRTVRIEITDEMVERALKSAANGGKWEEGHVKGMRAALEAALAPDGWVERRKGERRAAVKASLRPHTRVLNQDEIDTLLGEEAPSRAKDGELPQPAQPKAAVETCGVEEEWRTHERKTDPFGSRARLHRRSGRMQVHNFIFRHQRHDDPLVVYEMGCERRNSRPHRRASDRPGEVLATGDTGTGQAGPKPNDCPETTSVKPIKCHRCGGDLRPVVGGQPYCDACEDRKLFGSNASVKSPKETAEASGEPNVYDPYGKWLKEQGK